MHAALIQRVVEELRTTLTGRFLGKIYQLSPLSFAFDFGLRGEFLFVSVDPSSPRLYLIQRRTKELEKQSVHLAPFGQIIRARLSGGHLINVSKDPLDRIVRFTFRVEGEEVIFRRLVVQLTGRTANLFLLDELNRIVAVLHEHAETRTQKIYQPPPRARNESP